MLSTTVTLAALMVSRRQLLSAASAAGAGAVLAGCGSTSATDLPGSVLEADVRTLNRLIRAEYYSVAAYVAAIEGDRSGIVLGADGVGALRVARALTESSRSKQTVVP